MKSDLCTVLIEATHRFDLRQAFVSGDLRRRSPG
jgi:hypothetical protein